MLRTTAPLFRLPLMPKPNPLPSLVNTITWIWAQSHWSWKIEIENSWKHVVKSSLHLQVDIYGSESCWGPLFCTCCKSEIVLMIKQNNFRFVTCTKHRIQQSHAIFCLKINKVIVCSHKHQPLIWKDKRTSLESIAMNLQLTQIIERIILRPERPLPKDYQSHYLSP